jgi:hypothetical protein
MGEEMEEAIELTIIDLGAALLTGLRDTIGAVWESPPHEIVLVTGARISDSGGRKSCRKSFRYDS